MATAPEKAVLKELASKLNVSIPDGEDTLETLNKLSKAAGEQKTKTPRWQIVVAFFTVTGVIIAGVSSYVAIRTLTQHMKEVDDNEKKTRRESWQRTVVYGVIWRNSSIQKPMTFEEIRTEYLKEVQALGSKNEFDISGEEMQPLALNRLLLELLSWKTIVSIYPNMYTVPQIAYKASDLRCEIIATTKEDLLYLLIDESGKHTSDELFRRIGERNKVTSKEWVVLIYALTVEGKISVDGDTKRIRGLFDPRKEKPETVPPPEVVPAPKDGKEMPKDKKELPKKGVTLDSKQEDAPRCCGAG